MISVKSLDVHTCEIPLKLPSLNEYIRVCRTNAYMASTFKSNIEGSLWEYINKLPRFTKPIKIHFHWVEDNRRRDLDNIAFGKKFILDAMVNFGKIANDNHRHVVGFTDTFEYAKQSKVILEIEEVNDGD